MTVWPALVFGLLVGGMVFSLGLFLRQRGPRLVERLQRQKAPRVSHLQVEEQVSFLPLSLVRKFEEKLGFRKDSVKRQELKKTLVQAGIYSERAASIVLGLKLGLLLALPVLALAFLLGRPLHKAVLIGGLYLLGIMGYMLPNLVLGRLVAARQKKIRESLPDALDLMVVCVEAGQGLNAALKRVADDLILGSPALSQELLLVNLEINAGMEREQALRNLGERTGVEEVASLCSILIQSDRFGTSIGTALKVQSETLRTSRRQKLEELAAKTPVKLVFPLIFFIFPAIMVVILGPAVIKISESLMK
jgi:tight adherence protein C